MGVDSPAPTSYADVALPGVPVVLTYRTDLALIRGQRVAVPLRGHLRSGLVWHTDARPPASARIESIAAVLPGDGPDPYIPHALQQTLQWMSDYYGLDIGHVLHHSFPESVFPDLEDGYRAVDAQLVPADMRARCGVLGGRLWLAAATARKYGWLESVSASAHWQRMPKITTHSRWDSDNPHFVATANLADLSGRSAKQKEAFARLRQPEGLSLVEIGTLYANPEQIVAQWLRQGLIRTVQAQAPAPAVNHAHQPPALTDEQQAAVHAILQSTLQHSSKPQVLFGETGSGKTEVFYAVTERLMQRGAQVLLLEPEIGIATQVYSRWRERMSGVALYHSALSSRQRARVLEEARSGDVRVLIGARSAAFVPLPKLQCIIVDEEHETGYKAPDSPHWHGRNLALVLARAAGCPIVLATATPSLETWHNLREGRYELHELRQRFGGSQPAYRFTQVYADRMQNASPLPAPLLEHLRSELAQGQQICILRNRRGRYRHSRCTTCDSTLCCPACPDIPLVQHGAPPGVLLCHVCGYIHRQEPRCAACGGRKFSLQSEGTQRWEEWAATAFAGFEIVRIDGDSTAAHGAWLKLYERVREGHGQVLIGTQMLAKGFDLPNLSTMVIAGLDGMLDAPDPRAWERAYTLLKQASGRVGRRGAPATVWLDTAKAGHTVIEHLQAGSTAAFLDAELARRAVHGFPPLRRAAQIYFYHQDAIDEAALARSLETARTELNHTDVEIWGPIAALTQRRENHYRAQALLLSSSAKSLHGLCEAIRSWAADKQNLRFSRVRVDYDPVEFG